MNKGDVFALSSGCYSDYGLNGFFRAREDFNIEEEGKQFLASWPGERTVLRTHEYRETSQGRMFVELDEPYSYSYKSSAQAGDFAAYLTRKGLVEDADEIKEYHCGDYDFTVPQEY